MAETRKTLTTPEKRIDRQTMGRKPYQTRAEYREQGRLVLGS